MMTPANVSISAHTDLSAGNAASTMDWIPGIPFNMGSLTNLSDSAVGFISWFVGFDLFLVGLGLWARHKVARVVALTFFALAALFQFAEFVSVGILGSPTSFVELVLDVIFVYFLAIKFDS